MPTERLTVWFTYVLSSSSVATKSMLYTDFVAASEVNPPYNATSTVFVFVITERVCRETAIQRSNYRSSTSRRVDLTTKA